MTYEPRDITLDTEEENWRLFILEELKTIAISLRRNPPEVYHNEPKKPYNGFMAIADGTDWNPGSGVGLYYYYNGSWVFIA